MTRRATVQPLVGLAITGASIVALVIGRGRIDPGAAVFTVCILIVLAVFLTAQFLLWLCFRRCEADGGDCERQCQALYIWITIIVPVILVTCLLGVGLF